MSSTRHADAGSPFRQERFASSPEFERGLLGNLVAKRCELLEAPADRELIWFLQLLSHAPGGLAKVTSDLLAAFPDRIGTPSMHKFGMKPGKIYNADQVRAVRAELETEWAREWSSSIFALKGDIARERKEVERRCRDDWDSMFTGLAALDAIKHDAPSQYSADLFTQKCRAKSESLDRVLAELCLNPELPFACAAPCYFPSLIDSLREFMAAWIAGQGSGQAVSEIGRQVSETLDYAAAGPCMVLIDGLARTGKTHAAKAWCSAHPGTARYVQVPSTNDAIGFFRAIARSLGVSSNQKAKAQELRSRVEDVLQTGHLTLVLDESHYLFPQSNLREALPGRINWIMTALVNQGVPVALVTTPQFIRAQKSMERKSGWTSEQFIGRIGHYQKLPDSICEQDLTAIARVFLPEGDTRSIETLVAYAQASAKYLAAIESAARRARFLATKAGRPKVIFADVREAIKASVIPSDTALAAAMAEAPPPGRSRVIRVRPPQARNASAMPAPAHRAAPSQPTFAADRATTSPKLLADPLAA